MTVRPSTIAGVEFAPPDDSIVLAARLPRSALDFSVVVHNRTEIAIAFLRVRFEMLRRNGEAAILMSYADTLRNPEQSRMVPGSSRLVCVEHRVTEAVLRGCPLEEMPGWKRIQMNLQTLRGSKYKRIDRLRCML